MASVSDRRILVVEDEAAISLDLQDMVETLGATVIGPCATVRAALDAVEGNDVHCAVLDIQLGSDRVDDVAVVLRGLNIPFIFVTGYSDVMIPKGFEDRPVVKKPYDSAQLAKLISHVCGK